MAFIALDRYFCVLYPLESKYRKFSNKLLLSIIWAIAISCSLQFHLFARLFNVRLVRTFKRCVIDYPSDETRLAFNFFCLITQYALPVIIIVCSYARIVCRLYGRRPIGYATDEQRARNQRCKRKTTLILLCFAAIFVLSWAPLNIYYLLLDLDLIDGSLRFQLLCYWIAVNSTALNPIAYAYLNRGFMKQLRTRLHFRCRCPGSGPAAADSLSTHHPEPFDQVPMVQIPSNAVTNGKGLGAVCSQHSLKSAGPDLPVIHQVYLSSATMPKNTKSIAKNGRLLLQKQALNLDTKSTTSTLKQLPTTPTSLPGSSLHESSKYPVLEVNDHSADITDHHTPHLIQSETLGSCNQEAMTTLSVKTDKKGTSKKCQKEKKKNNIKKRQLSHISEKERAENQSFKFKSDLLGCGCWSHSSLRHVPSCTILSSVGLSSSYEASCPIVDSGVTDKNNNHRKKVEIELRETKKEQNSEEDTEQIEKDEKKSHSICVETCHES